MDFTLEELKTMKRCITKMKEEDAEVEEEHYQYNEILKKICFQYRIKKLEEEVGDLDYTDMINIKYQKP